MNSHQIVIVDTDVKDSAIAGIDPSLRVVVLADGASGIAGVLAALDGIDGVAALHILSHGNTGQLRLGGDVVDTASLVENAALLQQLGAKVAPHGDILLYGCDLASMDGNGTAGIGDGRGFVDMFAALTGRKVAASDDISGMGGDWDLEYRVGAVETQPLHLPGLKALAITSGSETNGNDVIVADGANDTINALAGDDSVDGGAGADNLNGHIGNDTLLGNAGDDTLLGHDGDDVLIGGAGFDRFNGGGGNDTIYFEAAICLPLAMLALIRWYWLLL